VKPLLYLVGPLTGYSFEDCDTWRKEVAEALHPEIACLSPLRSQRYLVGEKSLQDNYGHLNVFSSTRGIFTQDVFDAKRCDAVLVNFLGATKPSIGSCIEIGVAVAMGKPIVMAIEPPDHMHNRVNPHWHSMIREAAGLMVQSVEDAIWVCRDLLLPGV
jgi:nucleoside 2-deoxyribosyltransferase